MGCNEQLHTYAQSSSSAAVESDAVRIVIDKYRSEYRIAVKRNGKYPGFILASSIVSDYKENGFIRSPLQCKIFFLINIEMRFSMIVSGKLNQVFRIFLSPKEYLISSNCICILFQSSTHI
ncbi:Hypothetical predicted protein [Octopus vulgaris]|uniref:Uncharacterized protein n=1 Tax=Octopus vulgaris TaxID=6645 RepID=A0AA36FF41_OCTVU|nr:Hypothetical predicted protein [Octopus vulgaris]